MSRLKNQQATILTLLYLFDYQYVNLGYTTKRNTPKTSYFGGVKRLFT